jgi:hypothetical protein
MNESNETFTFTVEEHELLAEILVHAIDSYYLHCPSHEEVNQLPETSMIKQRFNTLIQLKDKVTDKWSIRFN